MIITLAAFLYIWLSDFKNTKGNIKERAVFLLLFTLSLALAILISAGVKTISPIKAIQTLFDFLHISY
ncbi:MAG: hypothetical protein J5590_04310 [Clostridia bacterium]|nr:hypothetical protein [Clostridia bacterium]